MQGDCGTFIRAGLLLAIVLIVVPVAALASPFPQPGDGVILSFSSPGIPSLDASPDALPGLTDASGSRNIVWSSYNDRDKAGITVTRSGRAVVTGTNGSFDMQLTGTGRSGAALPVPLGISRSNGTQLDIVRPGYTEWYVSRDEGIEQGITIFTRPEGTGPIRMSYSLSGDLLPVLTGQELVLFDRYGPAIQYGGLVAQDATGRELPAEMLLSGSQLTLQVDDRDAVYPVTIDPVITTQVATLRASDRTTAGAACFGTSVSVYNDTAVVGAYTATSGGRAQAGQVYVFKNTGGTWSQVAILNATDSAASAKFGNSVSVYNDTVFVGAYLAGSGGLYQAGQAYVYKNNGSIWNQVAILNASDRATNAMFGYSVSVYNDTAIIGAYSAKSRTNSSAGQAYVFKNNGSSWNQAAILNASDASANANFGYSVSLYNDTALIGAWRAKSGGAALAGQAYVFKITGDGWNQAAILNASDTPGNALFGYSVSLYNDTALVGAYYAMSGTNSTAGQAYVYKNNGSSWNPAAILFASDRKTGGRFGSSVSLYNDTAIIGAQSAPSGGYTGAGQAYLFRNTGDTWNQVAIQNASDASANASFGISVSLSNDTVMIGANAAKSSGITNAGQAYLFSVTESADPGTTGTGTTPPADPPGITITNVTGLSFQTAILNASDKRQISYFGDPVSLYNDTAVIGAFNAPSGTVSNAGQAYIFRKNGSGWDQVAILSASDKAYQSAFGESVSIYNDTVIVGAKYAAARGLTSAGQAYVYKNNGSGWDQVAILNASDASANANFGWSVSVYNDMAVIGAVNANSGNFSKAGQAYVFKDDGNSWNQVAILNASDRGRMDSFGRAVSQYENTVIVGADTADAGSSGKAYVFNNNGGSWDQVAILNASDRVPGGEFGDAVAIYNNTALVGAYGASPGNLSYAGQVYVFKNNGNRWGQAAILKASDRVDHSYFGQSVTLNKDTAVIGTGITKAYVFRDTWGTWPQVAILNASGVDTALNFGYSVSIYNDTALVGAMQATAEGIPNAGQVYAFTLTKIPDPGPNVTGVNPSTGLNNARVVTNITGTNFQVPGPTTVSLTRAGYPDIIATGVKVVSSTNLTCVLDLTGSAAGVWNVTVTNPDGNTTMFRDGFTITALPASSAPAAVLAATTNSSSGSLASDPAVRSTSMSVTSGDGMPEQPLTFIFNQPVDKKTPLGIIAVQLVPSQKLGPVSMILRDGAHAGTFPQNQKPAAGTEVINPLGINPSAISQGIITFSLDGSWLSDHDLAPADVVMMRYHGNAWVELPTTFNSREGNAYYFTATTPGFSDFAVTVRSTTPNTGTAAKPVHTTGTVSADESTHGETTPPGISGSAETSVPDLARTIHDQAVALVPGDSSGSILLIAIPVCMAGMAGLALWGALLMRHRKIRRHDRALFMYYE